ncbi:hypothetical protein BTZ20_5636 [Rhodococcus sp. MTM3W5.2]|nr:hypothetical protein BTZ20_5636 [Rhodococcus sp. MTM3W5.2]
MLLACLDGTPAEVTKILDEAHASPAGLPGLLAAMASATVELLVGTVGEDGARKTLSMVLLDASVSQTEGAYERHRVRSGRSRGQLGSS